MEFEDNFCSVQLKKKKKRLNGDSAPEEGFYPEQKLKEESEIDHLKSPKKELEVYSPTKKKKKRLNRNSGSEEGSYVEQKLKEESEIDHLKSPKKELREVYSPPSLNKDKPDSTPTKKSKKKRHLPIKSDSLETDLIQDKVRSKLASTQATRNTEFETRKEEKKKSWSEADSSVSSDYPIKKKKKKRHQDSDDRSDNTFDESTSVVKKCKKKKQRHNGDKIEDTDCSSLNESFNITDIKNKTKKKTELKTTNKNEFDLTPIKKMKKKINSELEPEGESSRLFSTSTPTENLTQENKNDKRTECLDKTERKKKKKKRLYEADESILSTDYSILIETANTTNDEFTNELKERTQSSDNKMKINGQNVDDLLHIKEQNDNEYKIDSTSFDESFNTSATKSKKKKKQRDKIITENCDDSTLNATENFEKEEKYCEEDSASLPNETPSKKKKKKAENGEYSSLNDTENSEKDENYGKEDTDSFSKQTSSKKKKRNRTSDEIVTKDLTTEKHMKKKKRHKSADSGDEVVSSIATEIPNTANDLITKKQRKRKNEEKKPSKSDHHKSKNKSAKQADKSAKLTHNTAVNKIKKIFSNFEYSESYFETNNKDNLQDNLEEASCSVEPDEISSQDRSKLNRKIDKDLSSFTVLLPWAVPELHSIETRVACRPTPEQRKEIEALNVKIKTGKFSAEEDEHLKNNWEQFCKTHDLPPDPTPFQNYTDSDGRVTVSTEERIRFVQFLAHNLDNRLLCSVYNRFKRMFQQSELKAGRFTPKEDKTVIDFMKTTSSRTPYADLAKILNRTKLSIEKRCLKLADKIEGSSTVIWNRDLIEEFMKHLVDITNVKEVEDLQKRNVTAEEWKELSDRLDLPVVKLRRAWFSTIFPRLFNDHSVIIRQIKADLINLLKERGETDWRAVDWDAIAKEFTGFTAINLNKMMKQMVVYYVPMEQQRNLGESLDYLREVVLKHRALRRHKIKRLKVIDHRPKDE